jgi:hypothetical protein
MISLDPFVVVVGGGRRRRRRRMGPAGRTN